MNYFELLACPARFERAAWAFLDKYWSICVMNMGLYVALSLAACSAFAFLFIQAKQRHELVILPLLRDVIFFI
jgi:hypothetical protein